MSGTEYKLQIGAPHTRYHTLMLVGILGHAIRAYHERTKYLLNNQQRSEYSTMTYSSNCQTLITVNMAGIEVELTAGGGQKLYALLDNLEGPISRLRIVDCNGLDTVILVRGLTEGNLLDDPQADLIMAAVKSLTARRQM